MSSNTKERFPKIQRHPKLNQALLLVSLLLTSTCSSSVTQSISSSKLRSRNRVEKVEFPALEIGETTLDFSSQTISGCKIYDSNGVCLYCSRDQYLSNSQCVTIEYTRLISNCNIYRSATECFECDENHKSSSDLRTCTQSGVIDGCKKWRGPTECVSCGAGFFLSAGRCAPALNNCAVPADQNTCLECISGFVLREGSTVCSPLPQNQISENCARYNSQGECTQCRSAFALDSTRKLCLPGNQVSNELDENCASTIVSNDQHCNICRQGFFLNQKNDGSLSCDSLNARDESCYITDFSDRSLCLVCMPNFEMKNRKCVAVTRDAFRIADPVASVWIVNTLVISIFGLLVIN